MAIRRNHRSRLAAAALSPGPVFRNDPRARREGVEGHPWVPPPIGGSTDDERASGAMIDGWRTVLAPLA